MLSKQPEEQQRYLEGLFLTYSEAEALLQQKFFPEEITGLHRLHLFLEHYVFLAWEMMSLLHQVHHNTQLLPEADPNKKRLLQISTKMLLVAESDINITGANTDLLSVYRKGMDSCGANSNSISTFLARQRRGESVSAILRNLGLAQGLTSHVQHTQLLITKGLLHQQLAALSFSPRIPRLDLILRLLDHLDRKLPVLLMRMRYYFDLEIMLQKQLFEPLAQEALLLLCETDESKWDDCIRQIKETTLSRSGLLADARAAMKRS